MSPNDLTIDYLKNHEAAIPVLAGYSYAEWKSLYDRAGATLEDAVADYRSRANLDRLPLALVALHREVAVGTVSLKLRDLEVRPEMTPCLASLFVAPEHRGRGIATRLVLRLVEEARRLQIKRLYLWTPSAETLYAKLGWATFERMPYDGDEIALMVKEI